MLQETHILFESAHNLRPALCFCFAMGGKLAAAVGLPEEVCCLRMQWVLGAGGVGLLGPRRAHMSQINWLGLRGLHWVALGKFDKKYSGFGGLERIFRR